MPHRPAGALVSWRRTGQWERAMTLDDPVLDDGFRQAMRRVASTVNVITICVGAPPGGAPRSPPPPTPPPSGGGGGRGAPPPPPMSPIPLAPPSLLVCINRTASLHGRMEDVSHFRVNVLHRDQEEVARIFADRSQQALRFAEGWTVDCERPPRLVDAQASLLCRRIDHHRFGTHSIFIGQVEDVAVREEVAPLVYVDGAYAGAI